MLFMIVMLLLLMNCILVDDITFDNDCYCFYRCCFFLFFGSLSLERERERAGVASGGGEVGFTLGDLLVIVE